MFTSASVLCISTNSLLAYERHIFLPNNNSNNNNNTFSKIKFENKYFPKWTFMKEIILVIYSILWIKISTGKSPENLHLSANSYNHLPSRTVWKAIWNFTEFYRRFMQQSFKKLPCFSLLLEVRKEYVFTDDKQCTRQCSGDLIHFHLILITILWVICSSSSFLNE